VYPNNYERAAWATVGLQTIADHPLGYGLLEHSLEKQVIKKYPSAVIESSHSAWIDFGLALGIPGLAIVLFTLASLIILGALTPNPTGATVTWIAISIVISYTVAEASSKHSIEVLFFMMALLSGLLVQQKQVND
jgi:O-antigen ligase